jgi:excisionase family DNA binding protein
MEKTHEKLLTIDEIARLLGFRQAWVRQRVNAGIIPAIRFNSRAWRFHWPSVLAALRKL